MSSQKSKRTTVAVHNGDFHPDDVTAVAILSLYLNRPLNIVRTRDPKILAEIDYVFDVGGEYKPNKNKYDHHQQSFNLKRKNGVAYSSAGLAWKHFGEKIVGSREVWQKIDEKILQPLDAEDSGIELCESYFKNIAEYTFTDYLHALNNTWKEKTRSSLHAFEQAVADAKKMLEREIKRSQDNKLGEKNIKNIYKKTADKRIIVLDANYSWKKVLDNFPEPLFAIFPDFENNTWHATAVHVKGFKFKYRLNYPKNWAGKTGKELVEITGVPDAVFCHKHRFIAVAKSKGGAIALAKLALSSQKL